LEETQTRSIRTQTPDVATIWERTIAEQLPILKAFTMIQSTVQHREEFGHWGKS